jgi:hypothetical protein
MSPKQCFQAFLPWRNTKNNFVICTRTCECVHRPENKEAVGSAWRLLQHYQLLDEHSHDISRVIQNFGTISKFLCIYSMTCHGTRNSVLQNPIWETLLQNICQFIPDFVVSHPRRQCSSKHNIVFVLLGVK